MNIKELLPIISKSQKLFSMLSPKLRNELLRSITSINMEKKLKTDKITRKANPARLYAISDSKRQEIFKDILECDSVDNVLEKHKKFLRHMDTIVFKAMFDMMRDHLRLNSNVISMYPEYFI